MKPLPSSITPALLLRKGGRQPPAFWRGVFLLTAALGIVGAFISGKFY